MYEFARVAQESLHRCTADPRFLDLFYEHFLASSEDVAKHFANTDFARQKEMLNKSLHLIIMSCHGHEAADTYLPEVARRHGHKDLNVKPELYDLCLDSLLITVREIDPGYSSEVEEA